MQISAAITFFVVQCGSQGHPHLTFLPSLQYSAAGNQFFVLMINVRMADMVHKEHSLIRLVDSPPDRPSHGDSCAVRRCRSVPCVVSLQFWSGPGRRNWQSYEREVADFVLRGRRSELRSQALVHPVPCLVSWKRPVLRTRTATINLYIFPLLALNINPEASRSAEKPCQQTYFFAAF